MESLLEHFVRQYSYYRERYDKLSMLKSFNSSCIITILPGKDDGKKSVYFPFGILQRNMLKGRIELMEKSLSMLSLAEREFITLRYFEFQSRDFVMRYLGISSVSTYKRIRRRVLLRYSQVLLSDRNFDLYFWDYIGLKIQLSEYLAEKAMVPVAKSQ